MKNKRQRMIIGGFKNNGFRYYDKAALHVGELRAGECRSLLFEFVTVACGMPSEIFELSEQTEVTLELEIFEN